MTERARLTLGIATAYALCGWLGLQWSLLPEELAPLFWPASGIALAAALWRGSAALPGILLGALLVFVPLAVGHDSAWALLPAILMSIAALLCAHLGAAWLRRLSPDAPLWNNGTDLLKGEIGLGVAATLPAAIGTGIHVYFAPVVQENLFIYFSVYWLGNFLGMLIFTPPCYLLLKFFRGDFSSAHLSSVVGPPILGSFIVVFAISGFLWLWTLETANIARLLERGATLTASGLSQSLGRASQNLGSIRALVYASETVKEDEFRRFTEVELGTHLGTPGVQAVSWAPKVTDPSNWESPLSESGSATRRIWERDNSGEHVPVQERSAYFPVHFIRPLNETNKKAVAFDLASEKARRAALERARDTAEPSMVAPIILVQSDQAAPAMLMAVPIYAAEATLDSVEARRSNLTGFATGVYLLRDLFNYAVIEDETGIDLHLFDASLPREQQWFHSRVLTDSGAIQSSDHSLALDQLQGYPHGSASLEFAGQTWTIIATPGQDFVRSHRSWTPWGALLLILMLGSLSNSIFVERIAAREKSKLERMRTREALLRAEAANESKAYFMAAASHDIKQPLYALGMLTDTLIMSNPRESSAPILKRLRDNIRQMSDHFDALMDIEMSRNGGFETRLENVQLNEFSSRIAVEFAALCAEKELKWILDFDDVQVNTDPELLLRLLRNLLSNAIRHTTSGQIVCRATDKDGLVAFEISDTGSGIDLLDQELILRKLQNPDNRELPQIGSGLGLSIVAKIAQELNLGVEMTSGPGSGTTFRFQMPAA